MRLQSLHVLFAFWFFISSLHFHSFRSVNDSRTHLPTACMTALSEIQEGLNRGVLDQRVKIWVAESGGRSCDEYPAMWDEDHVGESRASAWGGHFWVSRFALFFSFVCSRSISGIIAVCISFLPYVCLLCLLCFDCYHFLFFASAFLKVHNWL
ncbi:hypothetical protein FN846DRAFT_954483 [Sphaerosporella brunnea]|uniref:Uncharacterized protein n=1 Tax=Sphaerosporella brunnea TaxID=1250544 RepID=A0A5J5ET36_9PEZI|nr:hypothetical protein FN846DRAFT_954483 [Sphaerosporella brunnea]